MLSFSIPSVFEALDLIMKYYPNNFNEKAKVEIDTLFAHCLDGLSNDSEKFLSTLFIKSLKSYIGPTSVNEHIYLKKYEMPQIQLFNILIKEFPFVKISQQITNGAILNLLKQNKEATIIDIGIGQGTQIKNLLESSKELCNLKKLKIIGIEPFNDALVKASTDINAYDSELPFEIEFTGINEFVENIDFSKITRENETIIVNASLALHHIQSLKQRYDVIANIKSINPLAFLLIEPNVDHFEPDFYRRFQNCYRHFYSIFRVVDQLNIDIIDKNSLKLFFGREIEDIIGKRDKDRYERHEPAYRWIEKLTQNGFSIRNNFFSLPFETKSGINIAMHKEGFLGFSYDTETILAVIYAE
jgi:hypothetical protein